MKKILTLALLALIPFGAAAQTAPQPDKQSMLLIAALRLEDVIMQTSNAGVADSKDRGTAAVATNKCFANAMVHNLGWELGTIVPKILTRDEIAAAVKFFESPTGRKLMQHKVSQFASQRDGRERPDPPPSAEDKRLANAFLATSAGKKINETGYLLNAPETQKLVKQKADAATAQCKTVHSSPG
jgi:hypothetical protein